MKITATTEAVSSPPGENEHWSQQWRRNTFCAGQKPRADWTNVLQIQGASRKSRKPPTPFVGIKPYGKSQIKAKFELTLRNNGVPMNPNAPDTLYVEIDAFYDDDRENVVCYSIHYTLNSLQWIMRNGEWHRELVTTWSKGGYGTVGKLKASDALENTITKGAEVFANDYLKANPKK